MCLFWFFSAGHQQVFDSNQNILTYLFFNKFSRTVYSHWTCNQQIIIFLDKPLKRSFLFCAKFFARPFSLTVSYLHFRIYLVQIKKKSSLRPHRQTDQRGLSTGLKIHATKQLPPIRTGKLHFAYHNFPSLALLIFKINRYASGDLIFLRTFNQGGLSSLQTKYLSIFIVTCFIYAVWLWSGFWKDFFGMHLAASRLLCG